MGRSGAHEIEVAAAIGLGHGLEEEAEVAALRAGVGQGRCPPLTPRRELFLGYQQIEAAACHVEADAIAGRDECERPAGADSGLRGRTMVPKRYRSYVRPKCAPCP